MSYDVTFGSATRRDPEYPHDVSRNYTSNVSGMWHDALGGVTLGDLIDEKGDRNGDLIEPLRKAVTAMEADPDRYRAMNPENGWGDYSGALAYLRWMLDQCQANPGGWVTVWR